MQEQINQDVEPVVAVGEQQAGFDEVDGSADSKTDAIAALAMTSIVVLAVVLWLMEL